MQECTARLCVCVRGQRGGKHQASVVLRALLQALGLCAERVPCVPVGRTGHAQMHPDVPGVVGATEDAGWTGEQDRVVGST